MFFSFGKTKQELERELDEVTRLESRLTHQYELLSEKIEEKVEKYNAGIKVLNMLKDEYKNGKERLKDFEQSVLMYKEQVKEEKTTGFIKEIKRKERNINEILNKPIKSMLFLIKMHKEIEKELQLASFDSKETNLEKKAMGAFYKLRNEYTKQVFTQMCKVTDDEIEINKVILYFVKLEEYFDENIFTDQIKQFIEDKFVYHFLSGKESDRLDSTTWIFDFLLKELEKTQKFLRMYIDNTEKDVSFKELFADVCAFCFEKCILKKAEQIECSKSKQKRNLMLQLCKNFDKFNLNVRNEYNCAIKYKKLKEKLRNLILFHAYKELEILHESSYMLWFEGYVKILKDIFVINEQYENVVDVENVIEMIIFYLHEYTLNLSYVNRKDVEMVCFFYTKMEEFKQFVTVETECSTDSIIDLQIHLINAINKIAEDDCKHLTGPLGMFMYVSPEGKKTFMINLCAFLSNYAIYARYKQIEKEFVCHLDRYFINEILVRNKMNKEEIEEFTVFFNKVNSCFKFKHEWMTQKGIRMVEDLLESNKVDSSALGDALSSLYKYE